MGFFLALWFLNIVDRITYYLIELDHIIAALCDLVKVPLDSIFLVLATNFAYCLM